MLFTLISLLCTVTTAESAVLANTGQDLGHLQTYTCASHHFTALILWPELSLLFSWKGSEP